MINLVFKLLVVIWKPALVVLLHEIVFMWKQQYSKIQNYQNLRTDFVREVPFLFQDPIYLIRKPKLEFDQFCFR